LSQDQKIRENRLRRMASRQGLAIRKSRTRDPRAIDYGRWAIIDPYADAVVAGTEAIGRPHWTLDDVERYLEGDDPRREA
jgi:hypothetical protein